ncbi:MAG TPA: class I SAM-dependent methyltransferase [Myxococcota bacterium]|nr:class I SAM-dependent methyltransferase [Myxococcota bacterium]
MSAAPETMLQNRLRKRARHLAKWARREGVTCYRLYDCDIPELPLVIDRYEDFLHISVLARPTDPVRDDAWLERMRLAAAAALDVPEAHAIAKRRGGQAGARQYERLAESGAFQTVSEGGHRFRVNLHDYVDTGLFLDHRATRARVQAEAAGKRFLNLFCYTGAFTVYAAAGGAVSSTSVDLSKTYLEWAGENLRLNGFAGPEHERVRADALEFLARDVGPWDLAVLDPPTFSNSKKMRQELDLQRDHVALIRAVLRLLAPGGVLWFSTNFRRFKLDAEALGARAVEDVTRATLPPDFADARTRYCWRIAC